MLCASGDGRLATCQGDSGAPLVVVDDFAMFSQIGIVSWGEEFCNPSVPEVYTRISSALPEIVAVMAADPIAPVSPPIVVLENLRLTTTFRDAITVPFRVNAGGLATYVMVEWATNTRYGNRRSTDFLFTGSEDDGARTFVCNPKPGKTYWVRVTAANSAGIVRSPPRKIRIPTPEQAPQGFFNDGQCSHLQPGGPVYFPI
jgi:hypothetical protein